MLNEREGAVSVTPLHALQLLHQLTEQLTAVADLHTAMHATLAAMMKLCRADRGVVAQALESLALQVNAGTLKTEGVYFRQTADIDLSGFKNNSWVPIGNATGSGGTGQTFDGIYDGNGFRIKNFVFEDTTRKYYGLFGLLSSTAVIKNLTLDKSCSVTARTYVGGLVSRAAGATLINCTSYATVYAAGSAGEIPYPRVGGLAAEGHTVPQASQVRAELLATEEERDLIRALARLPEELHAAARDYDPSRINRYLVELAGLFHRFYGACRIKGEEPELLAARLKLADSVRSVIANCLGLLGVSAPEKM